MLHLDMHHRTPAPSDWRLKDVPLTTLVSAARHCANADLSCEADRASQENVNPPSSTQLPLSPHNVFPPCLLDDVAEEPGFDDRDLRLPCATAVCDGPIPVGLPDLRDRCLCPDVAAAAAAIPSPNHQRVAAVLFGHVSGADIAWNGNEGQTLAATARPQLAATMPDRRAAPSRQRIGAVHHKFQAPLQWFPYCSAPDVSAALLPPIAITSRGDFHCNGADAERASVAAVAEETKTREAWCSLSPRLSEVCRAEIPAKLWTEYQRHDTLLSMGYSRFTVRNTPRSLDIVELGLMLMQHFTQCAHTFGIADGNDSPLVANVSMLMLPIRGGRTKAHDHDRRGGSSTAAWGTLAAGEARDTRVFIWIRRDVAQNDEVMGLFKFSSFVFGPQVNKLSLQRNDPPMSNGKMI